MPGSVPGAFVSNVHEMVVGTLGPRAELGIPRNNLAPAAAPLSLSPCTPGTRLGIVFLSTQGEKPGQGLKLLLRESRGISELTGNSGFLGSFGSLRRLCLNPEQSKGQGPSLLELS